MATALLPLTSDPQIEKKFQRLTAQWKRETAILSAADQICMHPAYQQIIGMGPVALPLILRELKRDRDHWFWALYSITGIDLIPEASQGNMVEMARLWLQWGRENGLV